MKSDEEGSSRPVARPERIPIACRVGPGWPKIPLPVPLPLPLDELLGLMQDSLESLAIELGLLVASGLLEDEVTRLCGRRYERRPDRTRTIRCLVSRPDFLGQARRVLT